MSYKPGLFSNALAAQKYTNEKLRKNFEKQESIKLKEMGKFSAFKEVFEGIALESQDFSYICPNEEIITNPSFIEGRKFGFILIKNGFNEEKYNAYIKATEGIKHR